MTRKPRGISKTGIYHIMLRGINHCHLFEESADFTKFLGILNRLKTNHPVRIVAFCLMDNHVHLLLREQSPGIVSKAMHSLLTQYASWFNNKYQRSGTLFANRFKSECVESDKYLLSVLKYIHLNPVRAGIAEKPGSYQWSSYRVILQNTTSLVDTQYVLGLFANVNTEARARFSAFHKYEDNNEIDLLDDHQTVRKTDVEIRQEILPNLLDGINPNMIVGLPKPQRNDLIRRLRDNGLSTRQIERITGISRGVISRCV